MRTSLITLSIISFCSLGIFSCSKSSQNHAGKGGSATLTVQLQHHQIARNLSAGVVYIKYDATDVPASGVYDDSAACSAVDTTQTAVFTGLKNGNYFLYGKGYDNSIFKPVKGGGAYSITSQAAQTYILPVSED